MSSRAKFLGLLAVVLRTDTGWDALEPAWRDYMAVGHPETGGLNGGLIVWLAAVRHRLDRAEVCVAEAAAFYATHELVIFDSVIVGTSAVTAGDSRDPARGELVGRQSRVHPDRLGVVWVARRGGLAGRGRRNRRRPGHQPEDREPVWGAILAKLGARNRTQAAAYATQLAPHNDAR